jgi:hypothetical protein
MTVDPAAATGAGRRPFRVGEAVIVLLETTVYPATNGHAGSTHYNGWTIDSYHTRQRDIVDGMVLTVPGPVGKGHSNETPGYSVMVTLPDGTPHALIVEKNSIWEPKDRPLLQTFLDDHAAKMKLQEQQQAELSASSAAIYAKYKTAIEAASRAESEARINIRNATMPTRRPMKPHLFEGTRWGCGKRGCNKPLSDSIHGLKGIKP